MTRPLAWRTSTLSADEITCVEVAPLPDVIHVRDSKDRESGQLRVDRDAWRAFVQATERDAFTA